MATEKFSQYIGGLPIASSTTPGSDLLPILQGGVTERSITPLALFGGIPLFGPSNVGIVTASGGGTGNFLRADGNWAAPPAAPAGTINIGTTAISGGSNGRILFDNTATVGEIPIGTGLSSSGGTTLAIDASYMRGYLGGLTLSGGGSQTLTINAGVACSDDFTTLMKLASNYTKTFAAWAVGSGNGGLDTGAIAANTWYHVFIIERIDTSVVDVLISLSATAPTLPANYTKQRRIGAIRTDAGPNIISFNQNGDEFLWAVPFVDASLAALGTTATLFTVTVPPGVKTNLLMRGGFNNVATQTLLSITSPDETSFAGGAIGAGNATTEIQVTNFSQFFTLNVRTSTVPQIRAVSSAAASTLSISTYGWIDTRGRFT